MTQNGAVERSAIITVWYYWNLMISFILHLFQIFVIPYHVMLTNLRCKICVRRFCFDILGVHKVWLKNKISNNELKIK